jgi:Family of unknown function (DUF6502)
MARKKTSRRAVAVDSKIRRFERLLHSVALLMMREGTSESQISGAMSRALRAATKSPFDTPTLLHLYVSLSDLLHAWHEDPDYIDAKATPIPLSLQGRGRSVKTLLAKVGSTLPADKVLASLKVQRLVRSLGDGKYRPTKALAYLRGDGPEMSGYLGRSILHLIETNESNRRVPRGRKPLLDRATIVEDLPRKDVAAFRRFSAEQGANVVANTNAWLESRRSRKRPVIGRKQTVTAGLHVFAFLGPQAD